MANSLGQSVRSPLYMADATLSYTADIFREAFDLLTTAGRRDDNSLKVTQSSVLGMTVTISPGAAAIAGTTNGAADAAGLFPQGLYAARLDAAITGLPIPTAPSSGTRTDAVVFSIADKTVVGSGNNEGYFWVQSPYNAGTLVSSLVLATVAVPAGTTQILNGNITRSATFAMPSALATTNANLAATQAGLGTAVTEQFGSVLAGSAWDGVSKLIRKQFNVVATTNSGGFITVTFGTAFPNGLLNVHATPGDSTSSLASTVPQYSSMALSGFGVLCTTLSAAINTSAVRVAVTAVGW